MARIIGALLIGWLAVAQPALASEFDEGRRAYQSGDYPVAVAILRPLAEYGRDPQAQYMLGTMYANGQGLERDQRTAARWYEAAARQGVADAAFALGFLYYYGAGDEGAPTSVDADPAAAARWFTQAAARGNATAQYLLGHMYRIGEGTAEDPVAARHWLVQAAQQGIVGAQYEAGLLFAYRPGFQNAMEAYKWFELASRAGYPGAAQNRESMAGRLDGSEMREATDLANAWHPQESGPQWPAR